MLVAMESQASEVHVRAAPLRIEPLGLLAHAIAGAARASIAGLLGASRN